MIFKKFNKDDILYNKINVAPKVKIFIKDKKTYFRDLNPTAEDADFAKTNGTPPIPNSQYLASIRTNRFFGCEIKLSFDCIDNSMYVPLL